MTSHGVLYSRGESYEENRLYSDPGDWPALAEAHRREFLVRTDRGVFSQQAEAILNTSRVLGEQARRRLAAALAGDELERRIEVDLSLAGLSPPLHLPAVAGLAQGPGFPNLSCLGLLSDRILRRYVGPQQATKLAERTERV